MKYFIKHVFGVNNDQIQKYYQNTYFVSIILRNNSLLSDFISEREKERETISNFKICIPFLKIKTNISLFFQNVSPFNDNKLLM